MAKKELKTVKGKLNGSVKVLETVKELETVKGKLNGVVKVIDNNDASTKMVNCTTKEGIKVYFHIPNDSENLELFEVGNEFTLTIE